MHSLLSIAKRVTLRNFAELFDDKAFVSVNFDNSFGTSLKNELIAESLWRNIAVELKNAGFSLWGDITE